MKLLVAELKTSLYQELTANSNAQIEAIRIHLYKHNSPVGSLSVSIADTNGRVVATSDTVAISSISAVAFYHGYIRFLVSYPIRSGTTFRVYLNASGYTFSDAAYIGWCNDFDLRKYGVGYSPSTSTRAALDLEVWSKSERVR